MLQNIVLCTFNILRNKSCSNELSNEILGTHMKECAAFGVCEMTQRNGSCCTSPQSHISVSFVKKYFEYERLSISFIPFYELSYVKLPKFMKNHS